jgi:hypothetical protein
MPRPIVGTSTPIFVHRDAQSDAPEVRVGQDYFVVQIYAAQASFTGSIWEKSKRLVIASQVDIDHPSLGGEKLKALQRSREVRRQRSEQLGLRPNLIDLVPAVMTRISISLEYLLDVENRLATLSSLINEDSFIAAVSLAPGAAAVAKTVGALASKVVQSFMPAEERKPILQFAGDFNLSGGQLRDGYYVILGSVDEDNPLPNPMPRLSIRDGHVLADGVLLTQLSYAVFDVRRVEARTRDLSEAAPWDTKLREAEDLAREVLANPLAIEEEKRAAWQKCQTLLREAQTLLRSDVRYHRWEAENIVKVALLVCREVVLDAGRERGGRAALRSEKVWLPGSPDDRQMLEIPPDEDLEEVADGYAEKVAASRRALGLGVR